MIALRRSRGFGGRNARRQASSPRVSQGLLTSKELDPDFVAFNSENRRYHFPARSYAAYRALFIQVDPLSLWFDRVPRYLYSGHNPLLAVDAAGLEDVIYASTVSDVMWIAAGLSASVTNLDANKKPKDDSLDTSEAQDKYKMLNLVALCIVCACPEKGGDGILKSWKYATVYDVGSTHLLGKRIKGKVAEPIESASVFPEANCVTVKQFAKTKSSVITMPWIWSRISLKICCNGKKTVEVTGSAFPTHTVFQDHIEVAERAQDQLETVFGPQPPQPGMNPDPSSLAKEAAITSYTKAATGKCEVEGEWNAVPRLK